MLFFAQKRHFLIQKIRFLLIWAISAFCFENIFSLSFNTNFFWFFKLSTITLGQLSTFLSIFLWFFAPKKHVFGHFRIFLGRNQKNVFCKPFAQFYYGHFKPSPRSLPLKMCKRLNFLWFRTKLDLPAPVTGTGGSKGKNSLVPLTSFVPVHLKSWFSPTFPYDHRMPPTFFSDIWY